MPKVKVCARGTTSTKTEIKQEKFIINQRSESGNKAEAQALQDSKIKQQECSGIINTYSQEGEGGVGRVYIRKLFEKNALEKFVKCLLNHSR